MMAPVAWSRRDLMRLGVSAGVMSGVMMGARHARAAATTRAPRHVVVLFLRGGIDAVFTTDPRRRSEVAAGVDVPYEPSAIVESSGLRLGPHFAPLAPFAGDMAIVNGVQVRTANHQTGAQQTLRLRTRVTVDMPAILDIVALQREQPVGCVSFGHLTEHEHGPGFFTDFLRGADPTDPADLELLSRTSSASRPANLLFAMRGTGLSGQSPPPAT